MSHSACIACLIQYVPLEGVEEVSAKHQHVLSHKNNGYVHCAALLARTRHQRFLCVFLFKLYFDIELISTKLYRLGYCTESRLPSMLVVFIFQF